MKRKKKVKSKSLKDATPAEVAEAFAGEVMLLSGDAAIKFDGDVISTGIKGLNKALGIGGLPYGRIVEVYGPEAAGKTSLCLQIIARVQKAGGKAVFIDAEHALNLKHAEQLGVDVPSLMLNQPDSGEKALDLLHRLLMAKAASVIIIDSVAALTPLAEQEKGVEGHTMGMQAAMMSKALRIINTHIRKSNTLVIFTNQTRSKIGLVFGNPETTSGGTALKFYASMRIAIRARKPYKRGTKVRGVDVAVRVVKNKLAIPFQNAKLRIVYGEGWKTLKEDENDE